MPPATFSGALQHKNKAELKAIASALHLSEDGTNPELHARIRKHLDNNPKLEDNAKFAGLFTKGRRRGSEKPSSQSTERVGPLPTSRLAPERDSSPPRLKPATALRGKDRIGAVMNPMDTIVETPNKDLRAVSAMLKQPEPQTPYAPPAQHQLPATPSSLPPLPPSTNASPSISAVILSKPRELARKILQSDNVRPPNENVKAVRSFLSNSSNIWSLTAFMELIYILLTIAEWKGYEFTEHFKVSYPVGITDWNVLIHWFIPTLLIPSLVGTLVSFSPTLSEGGRIEFDPLTASIVRVAAQAVYPYERYPRYSSAVDLEGTLVSQDVDILGARWRLVGASLGVAFAFAEAIAGAPKVVVREIQSNAVLSRQGQKRLTSASDREEEAEESASDEVD